MDAIWLQFYGTFERSAKKAILTSFSGRGIAATECVSSTCRGLGIILYSQVDEELYRTTRKVSHNGLTPVLAVATSPELRNRTNHWRLLGSGATDVIYESNPADLASQIKIRNQRWSTVNKLMASELIRKNLIGQNQRWVRLLRQVIEVAKFTDASILLLGESGTGKERVANLVHQLSQQSMRKPMVILDCSTIVPELSGSEFFGHERGSFTGAATERQGAFERADNGTLFLDEIGELPTGLQAQLLRVIQEGTFKRVGSNTWHESNFRLISATNQNLQKRVQQMMFRADLYHRIAGWVFYLPALRERKDDIIHLTRFFAKNLHKEHKTPEFQTPVLNYLVDRDYPGNIRELKLLIMRIMQRHVGKGPISVGDIPLEDRPQKNVEPSAWHKGCFEHHIRQGLDFGVGLKAIGRIAEDVAVRIAVDAEKGNLQQAARKLGVTDRTLQMRRRATTINKDKAASG
jgi:transcriptional regulator with GAF, ATPase, and Fis domain